jgi:hypothetical protein
MLATIRRQQNGHKHHIQKAPDKQKLCQEYVTRARSQAEFWVVDPSQPFEASDLRDCVLIVRPSIGKISLSDALDHAEFPDNLTKLRQQMIEVQQDGF